MGKTFPHPFCLKTSIFVPDQSDKCYVDDRLWQTHISDRDKFKPAKRSLLAWMLASCLDLQTSRWIGNDTQASGHDNHTAIAQNRCREKGILWS